MAGEHEGGRRRPRPFEGLEETLRTLRDDEACADMDRRIAERLAKGGVEPLGPVEVPPDADRSSLEWLWAEPETGPAGSSSRGEAAD